MRYYNEMDIVGKKYNKWLILKRIPPKNNNTYCLAKCDCGREMERIPRTITKGISKSCGKCKKSYRREKSSWKSMKQRCTNPNSTNYRIYGGRGITFDPKWKELLRFIEDMGTRPKGKSLDRIDNDKGYSKENCRWSTPKEQANNRRNKTIKNI